MVGEKKALTFSQMLQAQVSGDVSMSSSEKLDPTNVDLLKLNFSEQVIGPFLELEKSYGGPMHPAAAAKKAANEWMDNTLRALNILKV
ncbi:MAG: hypothetical protein K9G62_04430 [Alphaproteobacteria bacterium]|nr:hypothetical protein [Alphaproteobacteria bacterium]